MTRSLNAAFGAALLAFVPLAQAHVTIDPPSASAGAYQKLVFKVGHGCDGSATVAITVQIPDGVVQAKPMPKPGWTLELAQAPLATPAQAHGKTVGSAVRAIGWKGGPLPDAWYDEFAMQVKLPDTPGRYPFKVTQVCEKGTAEWDELPVPGAHAERPAPVLEVLPAADGGMAHHH